MPLVVVPEIDSVVKTKGSLTMHKELKGSPLTYLLLCFMILYIFLLVENHAYVQMAET
jgi:hypothetical protein